ncbi:MAG: cytochrome b/b6 domain-containing protein [Bacteroidales bacterium]|nr:cytochrome b/b6 domain-containing protein [Bacteroidales bacterium]
MGNPKRLYLYPLWLRIWHHVNALLMIVLITTGLSMQYSDPAYPLIRFDLAVSYHNVAGVYLTASYFIFLVGVLFTSIGRYYIVKTEGLLTSFVRQLKYYLFGIFRGETSPFKVTEKQKFNPIQLITYNVTMHAIIPVTFITGWALIYPETIVLNVFGYSGIMLTSLVHSIAGFFISIFLIIHLYVITIGPSTITNLKSILYGYHEEHETHHEEHESVENNNQESQESK